MRFHAPAHVGDRALRRHTEHLRQRKRRHRLDERRRAGRRCERHQQVRALLPDDVIDQPLRGRRQHEPGEAVHQHERQAQGEPSAPRPDERFGLVPGGRGQLHFFRRGAGVGGRCPPPVPQPARAF
jgi:hypothetical protein